MSTISPAHKRILIKLSGEALMGDDAFGINQGTIERIVGEIAEVSSLCRWRGGSATSPSPIR